MRVVSFAQLQLASDVAHWHSVGWVGVYDNGHAFYGDDKAGAAVESIDAPVHVSSRPPHKDIRLDC